MSSNDRDPFESETVLAPSAQPGPSYSPPAYQASAGQLNLPQGAPSYTGQHYAEPSGIAADPYASPYGAPSQPYAPAPQPYAPAQPPYAPPQSVQPYSPYGVAPRGPELEKLSLASFICGVAGLVLSFTTFVLGIAGIVGLVLGVAGLGRFKREPGRYNNKWMAIVGIITGVLATLVMLLWILVVVWAGTQNQ